MTEEASGQSVEENNAPETTEAVTEGMTDSEAWEVVNKMTEQGTGDAPGKKGGQEPDSTLNLTQEQFTERLNRKEESTRNQILDRYKQKYAGIESLDDLDDILEAYGAAEDEERTETERLQKQLQQYEQSVQGTQKERDDFKGRYESALRSNALQQAFNAAGLNPDYQDLAMSNIKRDDLTLDGEEVKGAAEAVAAHKEKYPLLFAPDKQTFKAADATTGVQTSNTKIEQLSDEQFEDLRNRAMRGERITLP